MSEIKRLRGQLSDGTLRDFDIEVSNDAPCAIRFRALDGTVRHLQARDLFEALREMRKELEMAGCQLLCAGARPGVAWVAGGKAISYNWKTI